MASDAQERVTELLSQPTPEGAEPFSHFDSADTERGSALADELSAIAAGDGVDAAIDRAYEVADGSPGLAKYALKLFVTHDMESARELTIPAPEIVESTPLPPAEGQGEEGA
jgi:hypothetical protein